MQQEPPVGQGSRHVGIQLRRAYEAFTATVFQRLADQGFDDLRPAHAQVFQNFEETGVRLTELARRAGVTPQSMGALVDDLERLGYVDRVRDPGDRRAALIRPTDRGRAEVHAAREVIAEIEQELARQVGSKRFEVLQRDLATVHSVLGGAAD